MNYFIRVRYFAAFFVLSCITAIQAVTYTVPGTHASIAAANAAASSGDTVLVGNGIYQESFPIWNSVHFVASSGRPVIQYDGSTQQSIAGWAGTNALISVAYGDRPTFTGFEFNGINGTDTCTNLFYSSYDVIFRDCIFHGSRGYLFRSNRAGSAFDCEFYGPAATGWRALSADSVVNCRFHDLPSGIGYAGSECTFINNVIYECTRGIYSRGARDNVYKNNLVYHCRDGFYAAYVTGDFDPTLRPTFINNTFVLNQRHGIRISGKDNAVLKNNILFWNGLEDTSIYYDIKTYNNNKPGWDITYNNIGRYSDSLDITFADSINCIGNIFSEPLFADTAVGDTNNAFYLLVHSPCIDAGNQGIRDPDGSPSDIGCYGGPEGKMKAPAWLANLGDVTHTPAGATDNVTWPQYDVPANFGAYMVYHDTTTTEMRYTVGPANLVDSVVNMTTTAGSYPHKDSTWYRISVAGDSTGYPLGGGYTEMDTVFPRLLAAYYYSNGTRDPSDDELRLVFNEGIYETGVNVSAPDNYLRITGKGSFGNAVISSVNEFVVSMGDSSGMFHHNRTWISVRPDSLQDYYGNAVIGSVEVTTFNVRNLDNRNDFETISQAVFNATSDDFIEIYDDGYYNEQVDLNLKAIVLQADSLANPVINAQGVRDYGVLVTADSVRVVGIRCDSAAVAGIAFSGTQGGWAVLDTCTASPTGILCISGSDVVFRRSVTHGNADGIRVFNSAGTHVVNNICRDNSDDGIVSVNGASTEIRNNVCYANAGDGVETSGGGTGTISNMAMLSNGTDLNNADAYTVANNTTALTAAFTDTAANDFTLQQSSPLWGAGANGENIGRYEGRVWRKGVATKYHFINDAYGAAADDETLLVCPGKYYETLKIGKGVTIRADSGSGHAIVHSEYPYRNSGNDLQWNVYQTTSTVAFNLDGFVVDGENANVGNDNAGWGSDEHYGMFVLNGRISNITLKNITKYGHNYIPYGIRTGNGGRVVIDSCRAVNAGYFILAGNGRHTARYCTFDSTASGIALEGDRDTVRNCVFGVGNTLRMQEDPDRNVVYNNLFNYGRVMYSLAAGDEQYGNKYLNNTFIHSGTAMSIYGDHDTLINNIIMGDALALDVRDATRDNTYLFYNDITGTDATRATAVNWNMVGASFEEPLFADSANGNFYLLWNSPMIDRGDLRIRDRDGGRSDIGAYGGPQADTLAPAMLDSFTTALGDTGFDDQLTWDWFGNEPGDFKHYAVYRDTTGPNFQPDTTNLLDTITNVATKSNSYPDNGKVWFYKMSAVDTNLYGGGYALFDTTPPVIDTAIYYCNGTPQLDDDTLVLVMSEWVIDMASNAFDSTFRVIGLGGASSANVSTGSRVNDDTLVVTGFDTVFCRLRTRVALKDSVLTDYILNQSGDTAIDVGTWNVGILRTGAQYRTIGEATAAAVDGDSIIVVDAGIYDEKVALTQDLALIGYGIDYGPNWITEDSLPVVMPSAAVETVLYISAACTVCNMKFIMNPGINANYSRVVEQVNENEHFYKRCVFMGSDTAAYIFDEPSGGAFTLDSCDLSGVRYKGIYSRITNHRQTIRNCRFHDMQPTKESWGDAAILLYPGAYHTTRQYITNNMFYNLSGAEGIGMRRCRNVRITGNLFYNMSRGGINWEISSSNNARNYIAFNTFVDCRGTALSSKTPADAEDTVLCNLFWDNGTDLSHYSASPQPVADYNWFQGGNNGTWTPGAHSDSGYPQFVDTTGRDYRLLPSSMCLNFTDFTTDDAIAAGIDTFDLWGNRRATPSVSYLDVGAYEGGGGPPRVDSVKYWACGTDSVGDDTMKVWFRRIPNDAGTVPTGAGQAENAFSIRGAGDLAGATVTIPGGGDTNMVVIRMSNATDIPSHLRSELLLDQGVIESAWDATPAVADTDTVVTWNVYNLRTDTAYQTIHDANEDASLADGDTVKVLDEGYYTDTLRVEDAVVFRNSGTNRPSVRFGGKTTSEVLGNGSRQGYQVLSYGPRYEFYGFLFDGRHITQADSIINMVGTRNGTFRNCVFRSADDVLLCTSGGTDSLVIDSCEFFNTADVQLGPVKWESTYPGRISNCDIHGSAAHGLSIYPGDSCLIINNRIHDNTFSGIYFRSAQANRVYNNLIYDNGGTGISMYAQLAGNMPSYTRITGNTVYNNAGGGIALDSYGSVLNNVCYGNGNWQLRWTSGVETADIRADSIRFNLADSIGSRLGDSLTTANGNVVTDEDPRFAVPGSDFHLLVHSAAIDRGDTAAAWRDYDNSPCDMGAYGGPYAIDTLNPHRLDTLAAFSVASTGYGSDTLSWPAYLLDDYKFFAVYRGTDGDFVPAETNCIDSIFNIAALGARYANDGQAYIYKVSAVDSSDYGGGYRSATYPRIYLAKTTHQVYTVPGDTLTYAVYYDNDGEIPTADTFEVIDGIPANTVYIDTLNGAPHTGGVIDVDWYDGAWQEDEPGDPVTVQAIRWQIAPAIGAHADGGDASGADDGKTGIDTTSGDDAGTVYFRVRVR